jgi:MHS family proline/betaine transporter-like MFS transporter
MPLNNKSVIAVVMSGNFLDYYDFMLFAYFGQALTSVFFPWLEPTEAHLLSLLLTALPLFVRPLGGYFFGKLADTQGRGHALGQTLKFASMASLGMALLPGYAMGGLISAGFFILFRALQGLSLGGEYTTAGTVLMEQYAHRRGLLSALLGASGTFGSLCAFGISWFYWNDYFTGEAWRLAFGAGALVTYLSYYFREKLKKQMAGPVQKMPSPFSISRPNALLITASVGCYIGIILWYPMIYAHFYLTQVLTLPASIGLMATLIALLGSVILTPLAGLLADRFTPERIMTLGALLSLPLCIGGMILVSQGHLLGQLLQVMAVALFGGPMHAVMNPLFQEKHRSKQLNTAFMLGASVGGLAPTLSGWLSMQHGFHAAPLLIVLIFGSLTAWIFLKNFRLFEK